MPPVDPTLLPRALELHKSGDLSQARSLYHQILSSDPNNPDALHLLGLLHSQLNQFDQAIPLLQKSVSIKPNYFEAHTNLGNALRSAGRLPESIASYHAALSLQPNASEANYNLASALLDAGDPQAAIPLLLRALEINPDLLDAHNNLANAYRETRQFDHALSHYQRALALNPDHPLTHNNLAALLEDLGRFDDALSHYTRSTELAPSFSTAQWNRACSLLLHGDYIEGFRAYESRWQRPNFPSPKRNFPQPQWNGNPLPQHQSLLIHTEQGLGDAIQFIRYLPLVAERAGASARILLESPPELLSLFQHSFPDVTHILRGSPLPAFDCHCPLLTLPLILQTTLETVPNQVPYLRPSPALVDEWRHRLRRAWDPACGRCTEDTPGAAGTASRIGLIYSGRPIPDPNRSVDPSFLAPFGQLSNTLFFSLQKPDPEFPNLKPLPFPVIDLSPHLTDFSQTAAAMLNLDAVVTIDSAPAHLAGALARPTFALIPFKPDWRWLLHRTDSPWYPTIKLFRQPKSTDWQTPIEHLVRSLHPLHP